MDSLFSVTFEKVNVSENNVQKSDSFISEISHLISFNLEHLLVLRVFLTVFAPKGF